MNILNDLSENGWEFTGSCMCGGSKANKYKRSGYVLKVWFTRSKWELAGFGRVQSGTFTNINSIITKATQQTL